MADDRETRLDRACADFLRAADAGRPPDRDAWLSEYHDLAAELSEFLAGFGVVERVFAPLRDDRDATVVRQAAVADPNAPTMPDGYELINFIAEGGMGVVYLARQVQAANREVALKMIRAGVLAGESAVHRFRREAEAVAGLDHPNIVSVHEVGVTAGGQPFFSMKFIDGQTLSDWLAERRPSTAATVRQAVRLLAAVCRAVHYAHQRGFLHRDLKPGNILVDAAGVPHVTDFGLAKRIGERPSDGQLTEAGGLVGTLAYMAPEQARGGERLTTAADVYSLGAILFLMLSGRPLRPDPVSELMAGTLGRTPPAFPRTADRDLAAICATCLTEHPAGRFGSAEALADELDRWADGRPIRTRPPRLTRRVWLWVRRRPRTAALVALAAGLLAVGVGLVTWKWRDEAAARRSAQVEGARSAAAVARSLMEPEADGDSRELGAAALWWVRSFELAPEDDTEQRNTARDNLAALSNHLHTLRVVRTALPTPIRGPVRAVSVDGRWRAEGAGNRVQVFSNGKELGDPLVHDDVVQAVAFSPDGERLITGGDDHSARVWKYDDGWRLLMKVEHQEYVRAVAFTPDGRLVATGGADGAAQVWEADTGRRVGQLLPHTGWVEVVAFSSDGKTLATTTADAVERVWELSAAALDDRWATVNTDVFGLAPTRDGTAVDVGTKGGVVRIPASDLARPTTVRPNVEAWAVASHPRGTWVAAGGLAEGQTGWFSVSRPDGGEIGRYDLPQPVRAIAVTQDGSQVFVTTATTTDGGVWVWDAVRQGKPQRIDDGQPAWAVAVSPPGGGFVTSTGDGRLRDREVVTRAATAFTVNHPPRAVALAYHPDGTRLFAASTDGHVRSWGTTNGDERWRAPHRGAAWAVAVSPDGKWVWSGSEDGTVRRRLAPSETLEVPHDQLRRWAERATGLTLAEATPRLLTADEWPRR